MTDEGPKLGAGSLLPEPRALDAHAFSCVPWKSAMVALIAIDGTSCSYAKNIGDKRSLLATLSTHARLLVAWPGQHYQDIFDATEWQKEIPL